MNLLTTTPLNSSQAPSQSLSLSLLGVHARGGGGTQIWFQRGCAAEAAKPVPIFKGHFGGKGYPLLRVFSQENGVFVYFSDEKGENM